MGEYKAKIKEAMKCRFVGDYIFTEEELADMYSETSKLLRGYDGGWNNTISAVYDELFFVAMVNATKEIDKTHDAFWSLLYRKLAGNDGSPKLYKYLTGVIEDLGMSGKILYLSGTSKRYYSTVLAHAFAPTISINSFFDLCWHVFCEDMYQTYTENDEIFSLISESMKNKFSQEHGEDDGLELGSTTYSIRAGIKRLAIDSPHNMQELIERTIKMIDLAHNKAKPIEQGYYFNELFSNWWIMKSSSFGLEQMRASHIKPITDYEKIHIKYRLVDDKVVLAIPPIRLQKDFYINPEVVVLCDNVEVQREDLYTRGSGLSMATKQANIVVSDILEIDTNMENIVVEIVHSGTLLYQSKNHLKRNYILFKEDREITSSECIPGNYCVFVANYEKMARHPQEIGKLERSLYSFYANENEILQIGNKTIFFNSEEKVKTVWIVGQRKEGIKYVKEGQEHHVYAGDVSLALANSVGESNIGIKFCDTDFRLRDFSKTIENGITYYNISEIIEEAEPYSMTAFAYSDNSILASEFFVKYSNVEIDYDQVIYYDKKNVGNVKIELGSINKSIDFTTDLDYIYVKSGEGELILTPPMLKWSMGSEKEYRTSFCENLWYKTIGNSTEIEIVAPYGIKCELCAGNDILEKARKHNRYKCGEYVYSMQKDCDNVLIFAKLNDEILAPICCIALKENFYKEPFVRILNGVLEWNPLNCFVGDPNPDFILKLIKNNKILQTHNLGLDKESKLIEYIEEDYYEVSISLKSRGFLSSERELKKMKICIGDPNEFRFRNKHLKISEVVLLTNNDFVSIKPYYIDKLKYLGEADGFHFYQGQLYIINYQGSKTYLNSMQNSQGEWEKTNPVRIEMCNSKSCWMIAGLESYEYDDYLGEFLLNEKNQISNMDNRNSRGIDYYICEVKKNV